MFRFLVSVIRLMFFILLILLGYMTVSDVFLNTNYFDQALVYVYYLKFIGFAAIAYILLFILSLIEKLFVKKTNVIKAKGKNGNLEVQAETINELSKNFLEQKDLILKSEVITHKYFSKIIINAKLQTLSVENLNEKLIEIQNELKEYIYVMTGIQVREVVLKIAKITNERTTTNYEN